MNNICYDCIYLREEPLRCIKDGTKTLNREDMPEFCQRFTENW